jgi:hypothetical protein
MWFSSCRELSALIYVPRAVPYAFLSHGFAAMIADH